MKRVLMFCTVFLLIAIGVFAQNVRTGRYIAGDSRSNLDYSYWIELRSDNTFVWNIPGGSASGTWRYDGHTIYLTINTANGEMAIGRGMTIEFRHADGTGTVLWGDDDAWWLQ